MTDAVPIFPHTTTHPDRPPIYTASYNEFCQKSSVEVQDILRQFPVVVLSGHPTQIKCDDSGLYEFGDPNKLRDMHGMYCCHLLSLSSSGSR